MTTLRDDWLTEEDYRIWCVLWRGREFWCWMRLVDISQQQEELDFDRMWLREGIKRSSERHGDDDWRCHRREWFPSDWSHASLVRINPATPKRLAGK